MNSSGTRSSQCSPLTLLASGNKPKGGVTLQMYCSKIERATPKQLLQWLKRYDREYGTLYANEANLLADALHQLCMDVTEHKFGFLQGAEFIQALRIKVGIIGPSAESNSAKVMFGLDAKTLPDISGALRAGYRMFDTAQAYQNLNLLQQAIECSGLPRNSFYIVYKFDAFNTTLETQEHLEQVVKPFTYFDAVLIHNANESETAILGSWEGLKAFKERHGCKEIGIGNFKSNQGVLDKIKPVDIVQIEAFELIGSKDMGVLLNKIGRPRVLYYQLVQMMQSAGIELESGNLTAIAKFISECTTSIYIDEEPIPILSSSSQSNRESNLSILHPKQVDEHENSECIGDIHSYLLNGRNCTNNAPEVALSNKQREALEDFTNRNSFYRESWTGNDLEAKIIETFPDLEPILSTLIVPERIGLKKVYVGRSLLSIMKTILGQSSCDRKWAIELAQMLLMSCETWAQNKFVLVNIT